MSRSPLFLIDAGINILLGLLLLVFPHALVATLGIPVVESGFYRSILGGVLMGIGVALLIERHGRRSGLGLEGAIAINICGALVLAAWLLFGGLALPVRGTVTLWTLVFVLVGLSIAELRWSPKGGRNITR